MSAHPRDRLLIGAAGLSLAIGTALGLSGHPWLGCALLAGASAAILVFVHLATKDPS